jgi:hypothetical protein
LHVRSRLLLLLVLVAWGQAHATSEVARCGDAPSTDGWIDRARTLIGTLEPDLALPSALFASEAFDALRIVLDGRQDDPRDDETLARRAVLELASAYGVPAFRSSQGGDAALLGDDDWLEAASERVEAVGIAVRTSLPDGKIVAVGAYWSTPVMERLRVVRVDELVHRQATIDDARATYLATLSTCAVTVDRWIEMSEATARSFLRPDETSWMFSFGPASDAATMWSRWIPGPRIESALAFDDRGVNDEASYSALFAGRTPGVMSVLASLTTVRSSMTVQELAAFVRGLF